MGANVGEVSVGAEVKKGVVVLDGDPVVVVGARVGAAVGAAVSQEQAICASTAMPASVPGATHVPEPKNKPS